MQFFDVSHLGGRLMKELSSGEARRAVFARALVNNPKALILDEPTNSLDIRAQHEVREAMRKLAANGVSVILVTHHLPDIIPEIDRIVALSQGRIVAEGAKREVLTPHTLSALFGVEVDVHETGGYYHML